MIGTWEFLVFMFKSIVWHRNGFCWLPFNVSIKLAPFAVSHPILLLGPSGRHEP